nr:MAG TPA: hypothetical protein [Bacteriophage sp.]
MCLNRQPENRCNSTKLNSNLTSSRFQAAFFYRHWAVFLCNSLKNKTFLILKSIIYKLYVKI